MYQPACSFLYDNREVRLNIRGDLDGLQTFDQIYEFVHSEGRIGRVVLDFSAVSRVKTIELYYLLSELAADPRFDDIKVTIEGLQGNCMDIKS